MNRSVVNRLEANVYKRALDAAAAALRVAMWRDLGELDAAVVSKMRKSLETATDLLIVAANELFRITGRRKR
jgi:hypothetical protein